MLSFANFLFHPNAKIHHQFIKNWLAVSLCGLPFFLITHDWFRYGIITVILAVALLIPGSVSKAQASQVQLQSTPTAELIVLFLLLTIAAVIGPHQLDVRRGIVPIMFWQAYGAMTTVAGLTLWRLLRSTPTASGRVPYSPSK